ncbi:MAG: hypothetical protein JWN76_1914 [Chitinophagaceae bacterium]|nr:hypothetical protein [Chitinophagaceae bacterium]
MTSIKRNPFKITLLVIATFTFLNCTAQVKGKYKYWSETNPLIPNDFNDMVTTDSMGEVTAYSSIYLGCRERVDQESNKIFITVTNG